MANPTGWNYIPGSLLEQFQQAAREASTGTSPTQLLVSLAGRQPPGYTRLAFQQGAHQIIATLRESEYQTPVGNALILRHPSSDAHRQVLSPITGFIDVITTPLLERKQDTV